jgi:hypothetical protein
MKNKKKLINKKAQEEIVGFGMIVIIIAIILIIFLWFYLSKDETQNLEDYEVESFVHSMLSYTTNCKETGRDYLDVNELIFWCFDRRVCESGNPCEILNNTVKGIIESSWNITSETKNIGYKMNIGVYSYDGELLQNMVFLEKGNMTGTSKGFYEEAPQNRKMIKTEFIVYSKS